jgi:hypothetical protein
MPDTLNAKLLAQFEALKNINLDSAILAGATVLRNASYQNYLDIDPDAPETEFTVYNTDKNKAEVKALEEFDINQLEFGSGFSAGRPFMRPAIDDNLDEIIRATGEEAQKTIRGAI